MSELVEIKKCICGHCEKQCGILVHVKGDTIVKTEGNREHPLSKGYQCERQRMAIEWLNHPDQLMYPLKRVGERGEGRWQRVTWDDAMGEIGQKLIKIRERYGAEALLMNEGTTRGNDHWLHHRFRNLFGSPNLIGSGSVCAMNQNAMSFALVGDPVWGYASDLENTNCAILWGSNPPVSWQRWWVEIIKSKQKRAMKLIVIDPRCSKAAERADLWLQLRPATDGALALGMLNVVINEGLYDKEFVKKWTIGFEKLKERVQEYPVEKVAQITRVSPEKIIQAARMFATARPACICYGVATDQIGRNGTVLEHTRVCLRAITGNIDVPGGEPILRPGEKMQNGGVFVTESELALFDKLPPEQRKKQLGYDVKNINRLLSIRSHEITSGPIEKAYGVAAPSSFRFNSPTSMAWPAIIEGKPYPIKALLCYASNMLAWVGPTQKVYEAFKSPNLELFVVTDFFMQPTAMLADYFLPGASWMERFTCINYLDFGSLVIGGDRAIPPRGERKDLYEFFRELGHATGQGEYWPWRTLEEVSEYRLKPMGITFRELIDKMVIFPPSMVPEFKWKKYEEVGFATRSGKVELYSSVLEDLGCDPLPYYEEAGEGPVSTPEVAKEYPLILCAGGNHMPFYHSEWMQSGLGSRKKHPDPVMTIHPETAQNLGINEGDWAYIETRRGRIKQKAVFDPTILSDVILVQAGWWYPEKPSKEPSLGGVWESNANVLVLDDLDACDRLSGGFQIRGLLCKVYKA